MPTGSAADRWLAENLLDPTCGLEADGETLRWVNPAFARLFKSRRAKRLEDAVGPQLIAALRPIISKCARGWTEISSMAESTEGLVFAAHCAKHDDEIWVLLRDNSSEARLHESYRLTLAKERERQRELELEVARRIRDHEDDLAQFSEIAQLGPDVVIGFLDEARAQVAKTDLLLASLRPGARMSPEDLAALLRALHTLKGNARSMGLNLLGGRAHHAEDLVLPLRANPLYDPQRAEAAAAIVEELYRLIDRAADLHKRIGASSGSDLISRTGALIRLCGQVEQAIARLPPSAQSELAAALEEAELTVTVPVQDLITRGARTAGIAAKELKKSLDVRITLLGQVELRRRVAQVVEGALGHLVRNAVAHGIEDAAARVASGKPAGGLITLFGEVQAGDGSYHLGVEDDGAGIRPDRVLDAARRKGLIAPDVNVLSMEGAIEILKKPGFTTAAEVTSVSGRGVGLDAVESIMGSIGGSLLIRSKPGSGTSFALRLPASALAAVQPGSGPVPR